MKAPVAAAYFNCVEIEENVVLSFVPMPFTAVMIAIEIPAATSPYSMAVAPELSFRKALNFAIMLRHLAGSAKSFVKRRSKN